MGMPPAHPARARASRASRLLIAPTLPVAAALQFKSKMIVPNRGKYGSLACLFGTLTVGGEVGVGGKGEVGQIEQSESEGREED